MATDYATPVVSRIGTIALIAIVLMGSDRKGLEAAVPRSLPSTRIIVTTTSELQAALSPGNEGKQIVVRAGEYEISQPLAVPNRATLAGEGVMTFDESGLPIGFEPSRRTVLRSAPGLVGDILTLGDGATLRGLVIEDIAGRQGNPVVASSRAAGDFVSAQITECEIVNPNPSGITPQGPTGRGLVVMTRNPNLGFDPPPHEGAVLWVRMTRSIVRSPAAGIGVFAINFASHTEINLFLEGNVIGGGLNLSGGVSRPDAVTEAALSIESRRNLYRSDSVVPTPTGWSLIGGTTAPVPSLASGASTFNSLQIHSIDDEIKDLRAASMRPADCGARHFPGQAPRTGSR